MVRVCLVLLVAAAVVCVCAQGASYQGSLANGAVSLTADGTDVVIPATSIGVAGLKGAGSFAVRGTTVAVEGTTSTVAALQAAIVPALVSSLTDASCTEVVMFTSSVYLCRASDNKHAGVYYVGNTGSAFACPALVASPVEVLTCTSNTGTVVNVTLTSSDFGIVDASFVLDAGTVAAHEQAFAVFAVTKLKAGAAQSSSAGSIRAKNEVRREESRVAVIFIYTVIAIGMTDLAALCAIWQGWLYPVFPAYAEFWWFSIFAILIHLVSWVAGLAGWICILCLVGLYITLMPIVYVCIRWQHKRLLRRAGVSEAELTKTYGEQQEEADSDSDEYSADTSADTSATYDDETTDGSDSDVAAGVGRGRAGAGAGAGRARAGSTDSIGSEQLNEARALGFTQQPAKLGRAQGWWLLVTFLAFFFAAVLVTVIFFTWTIDDYYVWDRIERRPVVEFQPKLVAKTIGIIYSYDRFAAIMRMDWLLQAQTKACGVLFKQTLTSDSEKKIKIYDAFIEKYSIDMSIFDRPSYTQYTSVNDWFTRSLAAGARPVLGSAMDNVVVSGADCRAVVYESVPDNLKIWLKGEVFTAEQLTHYNAVAQDFHDGPVVILRLAPADYHRTHAPISGTITDQFVVKSTIYSVGADAMRSNNGAIYNTRTISVIDSGVPNRKVGFVAIGATCVGSVVMLKGTGATVTKGEDFSFFAFGGSTVVLTFPKNSISFDKDLLYNSLNGVETLIQVGSQIGTWN